MVNARFRCARGTLRRTRLFFSQKQYTPFTKGGVSPKRSTRGVFERFPPLFSCEKEAQRRRRRRRRARASQKSPFEVRSVSLRLENFSLEKNTAETQEAVSAEKTKKKAHAEISRRRTTDPRRHFMNSSLKIRIHIKSCSLLPNPLSRNHPFA